MHKTIKIRRIDSRTIKTRRREAQLTDSFGEALYLGLAPRPGREQQKTVLRQSLYWLDRKITAIQRPKQSVCSWLPIGRVMKKSFMARALNKNKKPESIIKRARNYFLGSFGSPCSFPPRKILVTPPLYPCSLRLAAHICRVLHHPSTKC